jgi:RimJ/RimL family protein N-acetyltransferase
MNARRTPAAALTIEPLDEPNVSDLIDFFREVDAAHFPHASAEAAQRFLKHPTDVHVLGRADGQVVAFGMLRGWDEGYEVPSLGIAVRRDVEGRGYGRAMMTALERLARDRGSRKIRLRVHPANARARRLYESCGYRDAGVERGETVMFLDLAAEDPPRPETASTSGIPD